MNKNKIFISIFLFVLIFSIASVSASDVGEISDHKDFSSPQIQIRENNNSLSLEKNCLEDTAYTTFDKSGFEKTSTDTISSDSDKSTSDKSSSDSSKTNTDSDKSSSDKSGSDNSKNNTDSGKSSSDKSTKVIDSKTNVSNNASKNSTKIINSGNTIKKGNTYKVTLKDANGKILSNKRIVFIFGVNKKYIKITDKNGVAYLTINAAAGKSYSLKYSFLGDDSYSATTGSVNLKVQSKTTITGSGSTIIKGNVYKVVLKDADGNPLANKQIVFDFANGALYYRTTDANGAVTLTINAHAGKTYKLIYQFAGDDYYSASSGSVNLKVNAPHGNASQFKKGLNEIESLSDAELAKYLKSSGYDAITSAIQTLANKLTSGKTSTWDKATAIFNYVRDNIAYSYYSNSQKGAAKTLSSGTGNCCDQANLVVALCRAAGIPARFSHAKNCKFNSGLVTGHVWAQIYIDGVWYTADATSRYNELGNIQNWDTNSFTNLNQYIHLPF